MKNKILAIFGIAAYVLSVLSSATDLEGNSVVPTALIIISGIATAIFIIMATIRLWEKARGISITLAFSAIILFILLVIQGVISSSYGSPIIILLNITKVIYLIVFIWAIVKLFKKETIVYRDINKQQKTEGKEKILQALKEKEKITNNDVEKLLGVSDATATNYLQELEDEGKIKQIGKTGKGVYYILNG